MKTCLVTSEKDVWCTVSKMLLCVCVFLWCNHHPYPNTIHKLMCLPYMEFILFTWPLECCQRQHVCAHVRIQVLCSLCGAALHVCMPIADPRCDHRISLCPMQFTLIALRASSVHTQWQRKQFLWVRNSVFIGGCPRNYNFLCFSGSKNLIL